MPIVLKSGSLNLLEPSGPVQACNGIALPFTFPKKSLDFTVSRLHSFLISPMRSTYPALLNPLRITNCRSELFTTLQLDCVGNVMAYSQKLDFVFRRNGRIHLNRQGVGGASVQSKTGNRGVRISGSNAGYTMFRGSVKSTGYSLHSPVSPSLSLPCVTVCHHVLTGLY